MMRIVILGCAASGKTTLARQLGRRTGVPVICLDAVWQAHWREKDVSAFRALLMQAHAGDNWISDGNFARATFDIRLPRATLIVWIERSRLFCLCHAVTRVFKRGEAHRVDKLADVLTFIWNFNRINRPLIEATRATCAPTVPLRRLTSSGDIAAFLSSSWNRPAQESSG
jgi:adenylate kinase family enzyme